MAARLRGRCTCWSCKAVYHHATRPLRTEGVYDQCGGQVVQREDDRPESIRVRMRAYDEAAGPLTAYYGRSERLVPVRSSGAPEQVLEHSLQTLREHLARRGERA